MNELTNRRIFRLSTCAVVGLLSLGCTDEPRSCELATSSIVMRATITHDDGGVVQAEVELETAGDEAGLGTPLVLCPEADTLSINGIEPELVRIMGHNYYRAEFSSYDADYRIELLRENHDDVEVVIDMPPAFSIASPEEDALHSRAESLEVSWEPAWAGQVAELSITDEIGSSCLEGLGTIFDVDDTGLYSVPADTLIGEGGSSCTAWVTLTRVAEASYPEVLYPGGSAVAVVKRRVPFTSVE